MRSTVQGGTLRGDSSCRSGNTISIVDSRAAWPRGLPDEADLAPHRLTGPASCGPKRHLEARLRTIRLLLKAGPVSDGHSKSRRLKPWASAWRLIACQPSQRAWRPSPFAYLVRTMYYTSLRPSWNGALPPPRSLPLRVLGLAGRPWWLLLLTSEKKAHPHTHTHTATSDGAGGQGQTLGEERSPSPPTRDRVCRYSWSCQSKQRQASPGPKRPAPLPPPPLLTHVARVLASGVRLLARHCWVLQRCAGAGAGAGTGAGAEYHLDRSAGEMPWVKEGCDFRPTLQRQVV